MSQDETTYRELQKHLDKQTIGFPAAQSGSDIKLLKIMFSSNEAKAVMNLTYKFEPLEKIYNRMTNIDMSIKDLERTLDRCVSRGLLQYRINNGLKSYRIIHFAIGMTEGLMHVDKSPQTMSAQMEYMNEAFVKVMINTKLSQQRTIPVKQGINFEHHISPYDEIEYLVKNSQGPFAIVECVCRQGSKMAGHPCSKTTRNETCMGMGEGVQGHIDFGIAREISRDEALKILQQNEKEGLIFQPSNTQVPEFICSCCKCCCYQFRMLKSLPNPLDIWETNYYAEMKNEQCKGCGTCVDICPVDARSLNELNGKAVIDLNRCIGCGVCVPKCPESASYLVKKKNAVAPPETHEDLDEILITNKDAR
jgi:Na+-translocating ferredoxin:NAD+ oxidoreductase subunit B